MAGWTDLATSAMAKRIQSSLPCKTLLFQRPAPIVFNYTRLGPILVSLLKAKCFFVLFLALCS
jgi:hypothetical protein